MKRSLLVCSLLALACGATQPHAGLVDASGRQTPPTWSAAERAQDIAIKSAGQSESTSFHWVLARGSEKPHVHDRSDLTVVVLTGSVRAHLGDRVVEAGPGDVIRIARGTPHWVENVGPEASESLALFSPPFDGKDRRFLAP